MAGGGARRAGRPRAPPLSTDARAGDPGAARFPYLVPVDDPSLPQPAGAGTARAAAAAVTGGGGGGGDAMVE